MITADKIKAMLSEINGSIQASELKDDVDLSDQGIESLDTFDFFLQVEEEYGVEVADDELEKLNTVEKIVNYVNAHK